MGRPAVAVSSAAPSSKAQTPSAVEEDAPNRRQVVCYDDWGRVQTANGIVSGHFFSFYKISRRANTLQRTVYTTARRGTPSDDYHKPFCVRAFWGDDAARTLTSCR